MTGDAHSKLAGLAVTGAFLAAGLMMVFHPTILSGFQQVQTDPSDTRFNNYLLEHSWKYISSGGRKVDLWSPAIAYPTPNALAFSDLMISFGPPYWLFRAFGAGPTTSFQLWMIVMAMTNFGCMWLFLRRALGRSMLAASAGASMFAFAASRTSQLGHQQLIPQFFLVGILWALWSVFSSEKLNQSAAPGLFAAALLGVAQLYGAFYFWYFTAIVVVLAVVVGLIRRTERPLILPQIRHNRAAILASLTVAGLLAAPALFHYLAAVDVVGVRGATTAEPMLPRMQSYFLVSPWSWFYGWMSELDLYQLPYQHEHAIGLGLVTTAVTVYALASNRRLPIVRVFLVVALILFVFLTWYPGRLRLWRAVYYLLPGASSIRAVARIGLLLLFPVAVSVAWWVDRWRGRWQRSFAIALALICLLEQGVTTPSFDGRVAAERVHRLAGEIDPTADAFLYLTDDDKPDSVHHIDAMWMQLETGVPTLNLYSGNYPSEWPFREVRVRNRKERGKLKKALQSWVQEQNLDHTQIQVSGLSGGLDGTTQ